MRDAVALATAIVAANCKSEATRWTKCVEPESSGLLASEFDPQPAIDVRGEAYNEAKEAEAAWIAKVENDLEIQAVFPPNPYNLADLG